jgi:hypothetical protein
MVGDRLQVYAGAGFVGAKQGRRDVVGGERCSGGDDGDRPPQGSLMGGGARAERGGRKGMDASLHRSEVV